MAKRKFSLGDILRKLNEGQPESSPDSPDAAPVSQNAPPAAPVQSAPAPSAREPRISEQPRFGTTREIHKPQSTTNNPADPAAVSTPAPRSAPESRPSVQAAQPDQKHVYPQSSPADRPLAVPSLLNDDEEEEGEGEFDVFRYVGIIMRRKKVIFLAIVLMTIFSIFQYLRAERHFTTRARLLFRPDDQEIFGDTKVFKYWGDREKMFTTHLELLRSHTVLAKVADNLEGKVAPAVIQGNLGIKQGETNGSKNDIIEISYKHTNAEIAKEVINELCHTYIDYRREVNAQEITRMVYRLETQIDKLQARLTEREGDLRQFKEENRMVQLSTETNLTVSKLADMELALQQTQLSLIESNERLVSLNSQIGKQELNVVQSMTFEDPFKNRIASLELELNTISAEYSPEHFRVRNVKQQIENLKSATVDSLTREAASKTLVKNPIRQSLVHELVNLTISRSALEAKRTAQEQLITKLNQELLKLPSLEQRYAYLQRETESQLNTLRMLKSRFEELKIKRDAQESDLKILELAEVPRTAVSAVKFSSIFVSIFIGLILGIALAFGLEYLDQSLKDPSDVEKVLEQPLLGIVPFIDAEKALVESDSDLSKNILEPFRALRANLKHLAAAHEIKTFIICSAVKGEGKTTLGANLAITFALDGKRIIIVDADLRRSQLHSLFGIPKEIGLADYLMGEKTADEIIKPCRYPNLFVVTSGERPHNPAELLGNVRFETFVQEIRSKGDYIIFDSPALLPVSDTITMAPKMDAVIMVARTLWTPLKAAKQAKNQLKRIGCKIYGAILNGVAHSRGYYPYNYGYYGYSAYRYGYEDNEPRKFSLREVGLNLENRLREQLRAARYALPRVMAGAGTVMNHLLRRKTFWILTVILFTLIGLRLYLRSRPEPEAPDGIRYIGIGGSRQSDLTAAQPGEGGSLLEQRIPAVQSVPVEQPETPSHKAIDGSEPVFRPDSSSLN